MSSVRKLLQTPALVMTLLCLLVAAPAVADVCNRINTLANDWNDVGNALEEDAGEDVGDLDVKRLERDVDALLGPTEDLGDDLIDLGNSDEVEMGEILLDFTDDLVDVDGDDMAAYLVDRIDDIVDALDDVVDYCDSVTE